MLSCCSKHSINQGWSDQGYFNRSHYLDNGGVDHGVNISSRWSLAEPRQGSAKTVTGNERFIENSFASARLENNFAGINRRMLMSNSKCERGAGGNLKDTTFLCLKIARKRIVKRKSSPSQEKVKEKVKEKKDLTLLTLWSSLHPPHPTTTLNF